MIIFIIQIKMFLTVTSARVAELADALDLGSSRETYRGSNPLSRTTCRFIEKAPGRFNVAALVRFLYFLWFFFLPC